MRGPGSRVRTGREGRAALAVAVALALVVAAGCTASTSSPSASGPSAPTYVGAEVTHTGEAPTGYEVTFRYYAPDAESVGLIGDAYFTDPEHVGKDLSHDARLGDEWRAGDVSHPIVAQAPASLTRTDDGLWELTVAMPAGTYSYGFVEGDCARAALCAAQYDPTNPPPFADNPAAGHQRASQVYVPEDPAFPTYEVPYEADADAGEVSLVMYEADGARHPLGVYLPAGYDPERAEPYPLLVLSHGMLENETGWFADGRAAQILDHAIADGSLPPVVMVTTAFRDLTDAPTGTNEFLEDYAAELESTVLPFVDERFHVSTAREDRAFGGLSMGGALGVRLLEAHPHMFGWYGLWSAAPQPGGWRALDSAQQDNVRSALGIHIGVGLQDTTAGIGVLSQLRADEYRALGIPVAEFNMPGAHTWPVWRALLHDFVTTTAFAE